jgi:asparagine synthase (glutamine-hydrolysing)
MTRWLAGAFDPRGTLDRSRVHRPLPCAPEQVAECDELRVAYSGAPTGHAPLLCLFDGHLDNAAALSAELGLQREPDACSPAGVERLLTVGYRRWGAELPSRLRGDFVLLLWDRERRRGLLARDQLGVRPCFLCKTAGGLYFASELRDLLALLPTRPPPDRAWVAHWISVSSMPGFATPYAGIERLSPGTALLLDGSGVARHRYWRARFREPLELSADELAERVGEAIGRAARRRLAPEGVTGVLMSGGLDSSAVAAVCAEQADAGVQACSATFPEHPDADESALIGELGEGLALPALRASVRPGGLLASAIESVCAWEAPLLGWGDFWTLPLMRAAASEGVTSMLDGDGGDELFGVRSYVLADRLLAGRPLQSWSLAMRLPGAARSPSRRQVLAMVRRLAVAGALPARLHRLTTLISAPRQAPRWLRAETRRELVRSDDPFAWKRIDAPRWWAHAAFGVTEAIEQTGVFEHQRRRAALAGVQARHPLLDLDLVELGLRQPPLATLDATFNRPVLRAAMRDLLPDSVRLRPEKARFEALVADCLRGPDAPLVGELTGTGAKLGAYVDVGAVRRELLDSDTAFNANPMLWMWQLWRLLTAECWLRAQGGSLAALAARASRPKIVFGQPVRAGV